METAARQKILLLDDDPDLLELYREILGRLPSRPEVHTVSSGSRALTLLASEPFSLLLCDLKMPKMDGLQVLSIVRRKFPHLRTAVLTCLLDEQFRTRAYAMGIDLFLEKPNSTKEIAFLLDCIESLLDRGEQGGFRGMQSKSLVDIIQLECLSQSSSVLKITNGQLEGKIWIHSGEIVDASTDNLAGVEAFRTILSWKAGHFEMLPDEPDRPRTIFSSYQGLLLETAQVLDENQGAIAEQQNAARTNNPGATDPALAELAKFHGVEFLLCVSAEDPKSYQAWGLDKPEQVAAFTQAALAGFRTLGENLRAGTLNRLVARGPLQNVAVVSVADRDLCVGFHRSLPADSVRQTMQSIYAKWVS